MNDYHIRFLQSFRHKADYEEMDLTELDEETVIDKFEEVNINFIYCQLFNCSRFLLLSIILKPFSVTM